MSVSKFTHCLRELRRFFKWSFCRFCLSVTFVSPIKTAERTSLIFTALHGMQTRSSDENSVFPSVKRVNCDKMKESCARILIPHEKPFTLVLWREETPSTWNFWVSRSRCSEIADFEPIFACSASAVTLSERSSISTNSKSNTLFPMSLRWSSYVAPKPSKGGAQKRKTAVIGVKSHFAWRKSATKFLCVKTVSEKVVRHSLA